MPTSLASVLQANAPRFHPTVDFKPGVDRLFPLDLTAGNSQLTPALLADTRAFGDFIQRQMRAANCRYGIGGYDEHRTIYSRSVHFDPAGGGEEPRRLHLGTDIWGPAGTPVHAFTDGVVHGLADNARFGDYGPTLIFRHEIDGRCFYSLYGHLSRGDLGARAGQKIQRGQVIAHFGHAGENGQWPPHLHLQLIADIGHATGDYPGVCRFSERECYLANGPDPDLVLQLNQYRIGGPAR